MNRSMDGLIELPPTGPTSPWHGRLRLAIAAALVTALGSYGALEAWSPRPRRGLMGIERRVALKAKADRRFWDGTLAASIEVHLRTGGRIREKLVPYWAALMLHAKSAPSRDVIIGKDHWLFLRERAELDDTTQKTGVAIVTHSYAAISRRLSRYDSHLVLLPIPRKAVVCADHLPGDYDPRPDFDDDTFSSLKLAGVRLVDPRSGWKNLEPLELYQRLDTHWGRGARIALAKQVATEVPELKTKTLNLWYAEGEPKNSAGLLGFLGIRRGHPARLKFMDPAERLLELRPKPLADKIQSSPRGGDNLLIGSSFTAGYDLHALISSLAQVPIKNKSKSAERPMALLGAELASRGPDELPHLTLVEFP